MLFGDTMKKIAIVTDSNSGITAEEAERLGVHILPMPFCINGKTFYEDTDLTQQRFFAELKPQDLISTSQPSLVSVLQLWHALLQEYDEIVHIPMSSALSGEYSAACALAADFSGRIFVVDNQRISATQRQSVLDAAALAEEGRDGAWIKAFLEKHRFESSIYVMVNSLEYLKRGGRITPAAAAIGTLLRLRPVLQIQGDKLDSYACARSIRQARDIMARAILHDCRMRFDAGEHAEKVSFAIAYSGSGEEAVRFRDFLQNLFPGHLIRTAALTLSIACHVGPGALGLSCCKKREYLSAEGI